MNNYKSDYSFYQLCLLILSGLLLSNLSSITGQWSHGQSSSLMVGNVSELSSADVFEKVNTSVVSIVTVAADGGGSGSGFIYDGEGHIITNNHVVEGGQEFHITFIDGNEYSAQLIGTDKYTDLAVLQIDNTAVSKQHPTPVTLANSSNVRVGEEVVAVGNPLGLFGGSVTTGVVSQTNRPIGLGSPFQIPNTIQTDAAIQPGNSGGPLFNLKAEVIGVNSVGFGGAGNTGLNFAVSSNTVTKIVPALIKDGNYKHPWVGAETYTLNTLVKAQFGLPLELKGVIVTEVVPGTPASEAGILQNDIITEVDGNLILTVEDFTGYVDEHSVGDTITLEVSRQNSTLDIPILLVERPAQFTLREQPPGS